LKRVLTWCAVLLALSACSKPSHETAGTAGVSAIPDATTNVVTTPSGAAPSASSATAPVPTPEDAEEDAAHRITEQNLESELDRLEREIQAE